jgi:hypothetical protein
MLSSLGSGVITDFSFTRCYDLSGSVSNGIGFSGISAHMAVVTLISDQDMIGLPTPLDEQIVILG